MASPGGEAAGKAGTTRTPAPLVGPDAAVSRNLDG